MALKHKTQNNNLWDEINDSIKKTYIIYNFDKNTLSIEIKYQIYL